MDGTYLIKQGGVIGPRALSALASNFLSGVKKQASAKQIMDADAFVSLAADELIKFAEERNLPVSVVERLATLFNSAKASSALHKTAINQRGSTVALLDPAGVVARYKQTGIGKKAASKKPESLREILQYNPQTRLHIINKDAQCNSVGAEDISDNIFREITAGLISKSASVQPEKESIVEQIQKAKPEEILLAKHSLLNDINSELRKMCSIVAVSGGPSAVEFLSDVQAIRPDLLGAGAAFSKALTKQASRKKLSLKPRSVKPAFLRSYGGLAEGLEKVASMQRRLNLIEGITKHAAGPGFSYNNIIDDPASGAGPSASSDTIGEDRVLHLFDLDTAAKPPSAKPVPDKSVAPMNTGMQGMLSEHVRRLRENPPQPSRKLVDADNESRLKSTFLALMNDEALADQDPYDLEEALNTLHSVAPNLAANPAVARVVVRSMMQYDGVDPLAIKQFAESEREMLRSLEAGRGKTDA